MLELAKVVLEMQATESMRVARTPAEKVAARAQKQILPFLASISLPSGFLLRTSNELNIVGTLKESGMEEPISTYYFKHGTAGLAEVFVIGIKEEPSYSVTIPTEQMIGAAQAAAAGLRQLMFPPDATTVTPIALFREI